VILVIDTSTKELLVGLADEQGDLVSHVRRHAAEVERGIHDARLAAEVSALLESMGDNARSITRIGIVIGPGSFTGLRIGLSFAKGLAFAIGATIVPITQHAVLATEFAGDVDLIVTEGYRPGMYYVANTAKPNTIELVTDLAPLRGKRLLAHSTMMGRLPQELAHCSFAEITPEALAKLTAGDSAPFTAEAIDPLEPLYVTDFTPGIR
jgi:tRNA threonylcarbamoyladenosine biosynthesis protein TsaB